MGKGEGTGPRPLKAIKHVKATLIALRTQNTSYIHKTEISLREH